MGTDGSDDNLAGEKGDDEVGGLGGSDDVEGGDGSDILYGGPGEDLGFGGDGHDVIYGGPGDDRGLDGAGDGQRDKIYCGEGRDTYWADKVDYVSSSCEVKLPNSLRGPQESTIATVPIPDGGGPAILLPAAALLLGSGILTYAILRRR